MASADETLYEQLVHVENKDVFVDLKKNKNGIYLKLSERNQGNGSRNTVLIPASGIARLRTVIEEVSQVLQRSTVKGVSRERKNRVADDPEITSRSIYCNGLPWETTDEELAAHFSQVGTVVSAVVLKKRTQRHGQSSMGCGVVEFQTREMALYAVEHMAISELGGRTVKAREDRAPDDTGDDLAAAVGSLHIGGGKSGSRRSTEGKIPEPNKVFITGLAWETTSEQLLEYCASRVGIVISAEVLVNKRGRATGNGVVEFSSQAEATMAIATLNGLDFMGRTLALREYYAN